MTNAPPKKRWAPSPKGTQNRNQPDSRSRRVDHKSLESATSHLVEMTRRREFLPLDVLQMILALRPDRSFGLISLVEKSAGMLLRQAITVGIEHDNGGEL